jgi:hypothetical protein
MLAAFFINVAQYYGVMERDMAGACKTSFLQETSTVKMAVLSDVTHPIKPRCVVY